MKRWPIAVASVLMVGYLLLLSVAANTLFKFLERPFGVFLVFGLCFLFGYLVSVFTEKTVPVWKRALVFLGLSVEMALIGFGMTTFFASLGLWSAALGIFLALLGVSVKLAVWLWMTEYFYPGTLIDPVPHEEG